MVRSRFLSLAALAVAVVVPSLAWADAKDDEAAAAKRADAVAMIGKATELTAFARGETSDMTGLKGFKSPEALVAAGGMLLRADAMVDVKPLEAEVTDAKGKALKLEAAKTASLKSQANALFDEARAMVAEDKSRTAALEALVKQASSVTESRGSIGGARTITRTLNPGETHNYKVGFVSGQVAAVSMTANGLPNIQFDIAHASGASLFSLKGKTASYSWTPQRDANNVRHFNITLYNPGKNPSTYTLVTN